MGKSSHNEDSRWGKGASDLTPDEKTIDAKTGFILAASLPLSILAFWKITLPFMYYTFSSLLGAQLVQKVSFLSQDIFSLMTSPCPPWITAEQRAFISNQSFQQVQRFGGLTQEEFNRLVDEGQPFIITDAMQGWPSPDEWLCLKFISNYPDAEFFDWQSHTHVPLEDVQSRSGNKGLECLSGELGGKDSANAKYLEDWLGHMPAPYFMDRGVFGERGSLAGFLGGQGTGFPPQVDESCSSFLSAQICGVTSWSFSQLTIENGAVRWSRPVRSFLQPGEVIIWFPAMRFHTEVAEGCSLNFRFGFDKPSPTKFLEEARTVLSSFSNDDREGNCVVNCDPDELSIVEECLSSVR